ncbi:MAG: hypothetical protein L3J41_04700 [Melioribacteraceae bacterium]|nr:hypothetical protein [Melioribacteraceae bacterium]
MNKSNFTVLLCLVTFLLNGTNIDVYLLNKNINNASNNTSLLDADWQNIEKVNEFIPTPSDSELFSRDFSNSPFNTNFNGIEKETIYSRNIGAFKIKSGVVFVPPTTPDAPQSLIFSAQNQPHGKSLYRNKVSKKKE